MTQSRSFPHDLAAGLAARLLHDLSGPVTGIMTGMELLAEDGSGDLAAAGRELATSSGMALLEALEFCRAAYGGTAELHDVATLEKLAASRFAGRRARLAWSPTMPALTAPAAQTLLIMVQIAATALASGGAASAKGSCDEGTLTVIVQGEGARAKIDPAALDGLSGRPLAGGLAGRWAPGAYLHSVVGSLGGRLSTAARDGEFRLEVTLPGSREPAR